jgi:hypothetical protein
VSKLHALWLILAIGLSAAINAFMQPRLAYELAVGERALATGSITLSGEGVTHELKLVNVRVVATEVARRFGAPIVVRELWLRSPETEGQGGPDLELFFDFRAADGHPIDPAARQISELRGRELSVLPVALGSGPKSRIRFPGAEHPADVVAGHFFVRRALDFPAANAGKSWRIEGDLILTLAQDDAERTFSGKVTGRLQWD